MQNTLTEESKVLKATHEGLVRISDEIELTCAVLEDKSRVFSQSQFLKAIGRRGNLTQSVVYMEERKIHVPMFLSARNLQPFVTEELLASCLPVRYRQIRGGRYRLGYRCEFLPAICNVFLDAREAGELETFQTHIADQCKILMRAYATVGVIALIDEATGFQEVRSRDALEQILAKYLSEHKLKWAKTFPDDFYKEIYRLKNWDSSNTQRRPGVVGRYTNDIVYERLAPGVLERMQQMNPPNSNGNRNHRHHQWLTEDHGVPELKSHLAGVTALMKASTNWNSFKSLLNRAYPNATTQFELELED